MLESHPLSGTEWRKIFFPYEGGHLRSGFWQFASRRVPFRRRERVDCLPRSLAGAASVPIPAAVEPCTSSNGSPRCQSADCKVKAHQLSVTTGLGERVSRKLGVHRRMVREAARNAVPAQRKKTERPAVKMAAAVSLIGSILELDRKAPRKQRHTSRRIYDRISSHAALAPPIGYGMATNG